MVVKIQLLMLPLALVAVEDLVVQLDQFLFSIQQAPSKHLVIMQAELLPNPLVAVVVQVGAH